MKMKKPALAIAAGVAMASPLASQQASQEAAVIQAAIVETSSAQERIAYSGKLRMLSQRIPAAACHFVSGDQPESARALLETSTAEFDQILTALEVGDAQLNIIGAEARPKTLAKIENVHAVWDAFKIAADQLIAGEKSEVALEALLADDDKVLAAAVSLVSEIAEQYANPSELVQADSFLIDLAGRQRMLLQQIAKESCLVDMGLSEPDALTKATELFSASLDALRFGMPAIGVRKPPTAEIADELDIVLRDWNEITPQIEVIANGGHLDGRAMTQKFDDINALFGIMNGIVGMYAEATKNEI